MGVKVDFNGDVSVDPGIDVLQSIENAAEAVANAVVTGWNDFVSCLGPLSGATVYYDANDSFDPTNPASYANDPSAVTASDGSFHLAIPPGSTKGQIVVVGGTDQSTGLPNAAILTAPLGARTITPLSTLVNDIEKQTGVSQGVAIAEVQQALGLPTSINPLTGDYIKQALAGDPNAARMFASEVQLTQMSYQVDSLLSASGGGTSASISAHFFNNLASTIAKSGGAPLNLSDPATVQALIQSTAQSVNVTDPRIVATGANSATIAAGTATIVASVNQYIAALPVSGSASYLNQVVQAQVVAEKTIAPLLVQTVAATNPVSINTVVAQETGTALANQIAAASFGSVNLDGATVLIANQVQQPVGNGDPSTMQFNVYLASNTPPTKTITVHYTTQDGTATAANGDYTPVSGTLTWRRGDTAPKTITVAVNPTSHIAADKLFKVVLSNPVNASIESAVGVGDIQYTDVATTTTLTSSTTSPTAGQQVTLTATVTNQDAAKDAGTGSVTFSDGTTVLGTANLVNGVATLTTGKATANLSPGTHAISATYTGNLVVGEEFDTSKSATVSVTVLPATQTINFGALADQKYGVAPILLNATSSSGLQVTYKILSGPAILVGGNLLTITGAGTISIEADQAGNNNYQAAPSVVQSFNVSKATLTFAADNQTMTYGGTLPTLTGRFISGFVNGDGLASVTTLPTLSTVAANNHVGSYAITVSGGAAANYTFIYTPGTLTITPASLTITADNQSMVQGSAVPALTASYSGLVNGDTPAALSTAPTLSTTTTSASPAAPYGTYTITASGAVDPDYNISYVAGTLNVASALPTITFTNTSPTTSVYGQSVTFTAQVSGKQGAGAGFVQFQIDGVNVGPLEQLSSEGYAGFTTTTLSAGSHAITASFTSDSDNYTDGSTTKPLAITVSPLAVTLTGTRVYDGTTNAAANILTISNLVSGDNLTLSGNATLASANVGSETITSSNGLSLAGSSASNYTLIGATGSVNVTQATPTLSVSAGGTYNGKQFAAVGSALGVDGKTQVLGSFTYTYYVGTGTSGASLGQTPPTNAGSYTVVATFTSSDANYTGGASQTTFTINPLAVTLTGTRVYDGTTTAAASILTFSNLVSGDNPTLSGSAALASANAGSENITSFSGLTLGDSSAGNYTLAGATGSVTITPAAIGYTIGNDTQAFGYPANLAADLPSSFNTGINGETLDLTYSSSGDTSTAAVGTYAITATASNGTGLASNYNVTWTNGALTVLNGGIIVAGTTLWIVGGTTTNDQIHIDPAGASKTGSTGIKVDATLNGVHTSTTYTQSFTAIYIELYGGNEDVHVAKSLTINTTVNAGNGRDHVHLGAGDNTVTLGDGKDHVRAGDGNNTIVVGNGDDKIHLGDGNNTVTLGDGHDDVQAGDGNNTVTLGKGDGNVQLGNGANTVTAGNGNVNIALGKGNNVVTLGNGNDNVFAGSSDHDDGGDDDHHGDGDGNGVGGTNVVTAGKGNDNVVLFGKGNNVVTLGDGKDNVQAGDGSNLVTLGNGNDNVHLGDGANTVTVGNGNDNINVGDGNNVIVEGNGNDDIDAGNGNNLIVAGMGRHNVNVGNGKNILIDGSVTLPSGDLLSEILADWISGETNTINSILSQTDVLTYNTQYANTLHAGSGFDWFWFTYAQDKVNNKRTDLLN